MAKNKIIIIVVVVIVIVLIVAGYFLFFNPSKSQPQEQESNTTNSSMAPKEISPDEIGLELKASSDNHKIQIIIGNPKGIKSITYEVTYEADSTEAERSEGGSDRIPRGITGDIDIESDDSEFKSPWIDLGSCSKNICRYDKGVEKVDFIFKITKSDNSIYVTEESISLE